MLCYKCLKKIPDRSSRCPHCGQVFTGKPASQSTGDRGAPLKEDDIVGHYSIRELVGEGPLGRVYKVLDKQFDIIAAIKILHPDFSRDRSIRNTTQNTFRSLSEFDSERFVKVYDAGEDKERVFIATDFLEGLSLRRLMEVRAPMGGRFRFEEAEPIIEAVCEALEELTPGEVHGDIKPENIQILPDSVKLTDLGLTRIMDPAAFVAAQVLAGNAYLAPELAGAAERIRTDPAVDVFAVGTLMYQLLTGKLPDEDSINPCTAVPETPAAVGKLVERALQAHPDRRYGHVAELHLDLAHLAKRNERRPRSRST